MSAGAETCLSQVAPLFGSWAERPLFAASHSETVRPACGELFRRPERAEMNELQARPAQPPRHVFGRDAEPAMGMFIAQMLEIVRSEIDDQQPALGLQHARGFLERLAGSSR